MIDTAAAATPPAADPAARTSTDTATVTSATVISTSAVVLSTTAAQGATDGTIGGGSLGTQTEELLRQVLDVHRPFWRGLPDEEVVSAYFRRRLSGSRKRAR